MAKLIATASIDSHYSAAFQSQGNQTIGPGACRELFDRNVFHESTLSTVSKPIYDKGNLIHHHTHAERPRERSRASLEGHCGGGASPASKVNRLDKLAARVVESCVWFRAAKQASERLGGTFNRDVWLEHW